MDATMGSPDPQDVPTLRDLIQRHIDRSGESRRGLGDRSGIAHQTLGYWWAGTIKTFPDPHTIRAFSKATGYSEQAVLLAAARTLGLRVDATSDLAAQLPAQADYLTPEQQRAIVTLIAAMNATGPLAQLRNQLVHGAPGSGKTMQAILQTQAALQQNDTDSELSEPSGSNTGASSDEVEGDAPAPTIDFPRRRYLSEVGEAAREDDE